MSFWAIFCPFTIVPSPNDLKNQNLEILSFYTYMCTINEWFLKYKVQQTEIFVILGHKCPSSPLTPWKIKILKLKKAPGNIIYFTHFHHKWKSYNVLLLRYRACQKKFFVILDHFLSFYLLWTQKIKIWKIEKIIWRYYHFTNVYQKWQSYMMYGSWDVECNGQNVLSFWNGFCPLTNKSNK